MRKSVLFIIVLLILGLGLVGWFVTNEGTGSAVRINSCITMEESEDCIRFPSITGMNLLDETLAFPDDFAHEYNLVVVPFDRDQQTDAGTWFEPLKALASQYDNVGYYSIAALPQMNEGIQLLVKVGLNAVVSAEEDQAVVVISFLEDQDLFTQGLNLPNRETFPVYILNQVGEVLWQSAGGYTDEAGAALGAELDRLFGE